MGEGLIRYFVKSEIKEENDFKTGRIDYSVVEDVYKRGLLNPLTVWQRNRRDFVLIDGYSRIRAIKDENFPAFVVNGDFFNAMCERFKRNNIRGVRSFFEVAKAVKSLKRVYEEQKIINEFLPSTGLHSSQNILKNLYKIMRLPAKICSVLEDKKAPLKTYQLASLINNKILLESTTTIQRLNLSLSRIKELLELLFLYQQKRGVQKTISFLKNLNHKKISYDTLSGEFLKEVDKQVWEVNQKLKRLESEIKKKGPFALDWDKELENTSFYLKVALNSNNDIDNFINALTKPDTIEILKKFSRTLERGEDI